MESGFLMMNRRNDRTSLDIFIRCWLTIRYSTALLRYIYRWIIIWLIVSTWRNTFIINWWCYLNNLIMMNSFFIMMRNNFFVIINRWCYLNNLIMINSFFIVMRNYFFVMDSGFVLMNRRNDRTSLNIFIRSWLTNRCPSTLLRYIYIVCWIVLTKCLFIIRNFVLILKIVFFIKLIDGRNNLTNLCIFVFILRINNYICFIISYFCCFSNWYCNFFLIIV